MLVNSTSGCGTRGKALQQNITFVRARFILLQEAKQSSAMSETCLCWENISPW